MKSWLVIFLFGWCVIPRVGHAQLYASIKRSELLERLPSARADSNKVSLLLDLGKAYLSANLPDSAVFYLNQAAPLSRSLSLTSSYDKACLFLCRANTMMGNIKTAEAIAAGSSGLQKMTLLQEISEHYSFRPGNLPANLDSAWPYIEQAVRVADSLHTRPAIENMRVVQAKYYYQRGETQKGIDCFMQNIHDEQTAGVKEREAHWWSELGLYTPGTAATIDFDLAAHTNAMRLYAGLGKQSEALHALMDISEHHWVKGELKMAEQEQQQVIAGLKKLGQAKLYNNYRKLANTELSLGNANLAMQLILMAKKNMDSLHEDYAAGQLDKQLGDIYWALHDWNKSLYWYKLSLQEMQGRRDLTIYRPALRVAQALVLLGQTQQAEEFLARFEKTDPPVRNRDKEYLAMAWGNIYESLKLYDAAEINFQNMIRYQDLALEDDKKDIEWLFDVMRPESDYDFGRFYADRGEYKKAKPYLLAQLNLGFGVPLSPHIKNDTYLLLYKTDSALGNYIAAMRYRLRYERYSDSVSSLAKERQLAELQVQYETEKKDRDILLLNNQAKLQKADLSNSVMIRNLIGAGLMIMIIICTLLYRQYRQKQQATRTLQTLIDEKEWLLKEVHHRVKNNLQTIVGLLRSQSVYLTDDALEALQDSQNRVYSISLIHQKLYQGKRNDAVDMAQYLPELLDHLKTLYGVNQFIQFQLDIIPLEVNLRQAVSLGLILNEAITNAIKYAFPARQKGVVSIRLSRQTNDIVDLMISDNGAGLPADFDERRGDSLGLRLMQGLTDDLGGRFTITTRNGTIVHIRFVANATYERSLDILDAADSRLFN
jgi:two-component sensor histidine kinase